MTHPSSLAYAHCFLAVQACMSHDVQRTRNYAEAAIELGQRHGLPSWMAMASAPRGWALIEQGQAAEGLTQLQDGTAALRARGFAHFAPFFLALQAETWQRITVPREASADVSAAWAIVQNGADRFWMAELHRLEGELIRAEGRDGKITEHWAMADMLSLMQQLGAVPAPS